MIRLSDIITKVEAYHPSADLDLVKKAYVFAAKAHDGQQRRSGDPYVVHPLSVASIITDLRLDVPSVCAGLLHDCVEDTSATVEELGQLFGGEVAFLRAGMRFSSPIDCGKIFCSPNILCFSLTGLGLPAVESDPGSRGSRRPEIGRAGWPRERRSFGMGPAPGRGVE